MKRGITLLEVLISMFVLLVGILGVASLLPVGRFEVQRGAKYDRSSVAGRAALREIKVRGMLDPRQWCLPNGQRVMTDDQSFSLDNGTTKGPLFACAIDPLGIGDGGANSFGQWFPYDSAAVPTQRRLPRLTLGPDAAAAARAAMADMVFRCQDDLQFDAPADEDQLPSQMLQSDARRLSEGNYSWLLTVTPDNRLISGAAVADAQVRVSVAVFFKRNLGTPGAMERICDLLNPAGNGEVQLSVTAANVPSTEPYNGDGVKYLEVKPSQWLMVASTPDATVTFPQWSVSWQRISAVDSVQGTGPWTRAITLAGADQQFQTGANAQNKAYLFDGVIAVLERTMRLAIDTPF